MKFDRRNSSTCKRTVSILVTSGPTMSSQMVLLMMIAASTIAQTRADDQTTTTTPASVIRLLLSKSNQRIATAKTMTTATTTTMPYAPQVLPSVATSQLATTTTTAFPSHLLERLLIQAESLHLSHRISHEPNTTRGSSISDHEQEDTLELSKLITSTPATIQVFEEESTTSNAINKQQRQLTSRIGSSNKTVLDHLTQTPTRVSDYNDELSTSDPDYELMESNKISSTSSINNNREPPSPLDTSIGITISNTFETTSCEQAYRECDLRKACSPSLRAYQNECQSDLDRMLSVASSGNKTINMSNQQCPTPCLRALVGLRSSDNSEQLMNCDCEDDEYCLQSKSKSQSVCQKQVEEAIAPDTQVTCSVANWICMSDQSCMDALELFYENCRAPLLSQRQCTPKCNNSLTILYKQAKAAKLINCICDGSEEVFQYCEKYKTYTERYCLADSYESDNDSVAKDSDDNEAIYLNHSSNDNNNVNNNRTASGRDYDVAYDDEDINDTNNDDPSAISNLSKHQEDNYIPFISNRYFNNLQQQQHQQPLQLQSKKIHKQQQRQQQQPTNRPVKQRQKKLPPAQQHQHHQRQQQQHQNNRHPRRNRVLAYASTSSSSSRSTQLDLVTRGYAYCHLLLLPVMMILWLSTTSEDLVL